MNITINIVAGSPAELQEAIASLSGMVTNAVAPVTEKAKRVSKDTTKPEKSPDPDQGKQPDPESTPEKMDEATEETPETEVIPTVVELRAAAQVKGGTLEGKKAIKALLDEFESKSISDVPDEKRAAFLHRLEAL
jgi:hypothetical protein